MREVGIRRVHPSKTSALIFRILYVLFDFGYLNYPMTLWHLRAMVILLCKVSSMNPSKVTLVRLVLDKDLQRRQVMYVVTLLV